ncbi:hypothetical protein [Streptomyces sp. NPDC008092]|uniref:hypothetical protein n=1 Tax=Streptomyces sp. NPDC008092 TaxID=3364808 RepID=UPI0036EABAB6
MSLMTFDVLTDGFANDPAHSAGRADAYDDTKTLTVDELVIRAGMHADHHPNLAYAVGYMDRVIELRLELDAVSEAETELVWTDRITP